MGFGLPVKLLAALGCAILAPLAGAAPAAAQSEAPAHSNLDTQVVRTISGDWEHFTITLLIPPADTDIGPYQEIYLYGSLGGSDERQMYIGPCWGEPQCFSGFPFKTGPFVPGTHVVVETDLPRSFTEAKGANFHLGLGQRDRFIPSNNLLQKPPTTL